MDFNRRKLSALTSSAVLLAVLIAASGCSDKKEASAIDAAANSSTDAAANAGATASPGIDDVGQEAGTEPAAAGSAEDPRATADRHHQQEMDHSEMRMGNMPPDHPQNGDQQNNSQSMPMKDM